MDCVDDKTERDENERKLWALRHYYGERIHDIPPVGSFWRGNSIGIFNSTVVCKISAVIEPKEFAHFCDAGHCISRRLAFYLDKKHDIKYIVLATMDFDNFPPEKGSISDFVLNDFITQFDRVDSPLESIPIGNNNPSVKDLTGAFRGLDVSLLGELTKDFKTLDASLHDRKEYNEDEWYIV